MSASHRTRSLSQSALLTAVPGLLGFVPDHSLIVLAFGDDPRVVQTAMRHDLVLDDAGELVAALRGVLTGLADVCVRNDVQAVILVIADDRYPVGDERYRRICTVADGLFSTVGGVAAGFVVGEFVEGARWQRVWDPRPSARARERGRRAVVPIAPSASTRGRIGDPHASPTALAKALQTGRRVLGQRSDMAAMLTPLPHCVGPHAVESDPPGAQETVLDDGVLLRRVIGQIIAQGPPGRSAEPATLDCPTVSMLGVALTRIPVRDAALAFAVTDLRHAAEALWRELTRRLTGSQRASAATMLAHLHYLNGEGGYAGVALDCALAADPHWSLANLLDQALQGGIPPHLLHQTIADSYDVASTLGVPLPAPSTDREVG